jgi:glycerophosphoryl diester phosphodiesterase
MLGACDRRDVEPPLIVAHRGASYLAPENTLAAFNLAWSLNADLIEVDVYLSADGIIVCHHDATTKKTAGIDERVEDQTLAELKQLDVGAWKDPQYAGEPLPTLEEVLATVPQDKAILIESKADVHIVPPLIEIIDSSNLALEQMTVICFDEKVIEAVKKQKPALNAFWLVDFEKQKLGGWRPTTDQIIETAQRIGADGVDLEDNFQVIDRQFVQSLREAGLQVHVWTVDNSDVARRLAELGVDSITTNRPGWLRRQLSGEG